MNRFLLRLLRRLRRYLRGTVLLRPARPCLISLRAWEG